MAVPASASEPLTHQATGVKIGEITPTSVRFWTRRTKMSSRAAYGIKPSPGLKAAFKVFVVLTTGNERGSNAVKIERPV